MACNLAVLLSSKVNCLPFAAPTRFLLRRALSAVGSFLHESRSTDGAQRLLVLGLQRRLARIGGLGPRVSDALVESRMGVEDLVRAGTRPCAAARIARHQPLEEIGETSRANPGPAQQFDGAAIRCPLSLARVAKLKQQYAEARDRLRSP